MNSAESLAIGIFVNAGTRDERWPEEAGLAHALEHMNLRGTKKFPTSESLNSYIEGVGGNKGAWTDKEGTFYYGRAPYQYRERLFEVLFEAVQNPLLLEERISVERGSILKEIRRKIDNPPETLYDLTLDFIFKEHPLSRKTLGTEEAVEGFQRKDFVKFREKFYNSANYVIFFIGNAGENEVIELVEKYFKNEKFSGKNIRKEVAWKPGSEQALYKHRDVSQAYFSLAAPFRETPRDYSSLRALDMFSVMISGGTASPLFQEMREKRGLCYTVQSGVRHFSDLGFFYIQAGTDPKQYREAIDTARNVMERSKKDDALLQRTKKYRLGQLRLGYENTGDILGTAAHQMLSYGEPRDFFKIEKEINDFKISDIEKVVDSYLKPDLIKEVAIFPKQSEAPSN